MAADLVPIRLDISAGDRYTLWAPRWRDAGDEWEAFLGKGDDLYVFDNVPDLVAFVRTNTDNDLVDHPAWAKLTPANAHKLDPAKTNRFDLLAAEELVAGKPTEKSIDALLGILSVVSSIGSVCDLTAVAKFFNGHPNLGLLGGGPDNFTGRAGRKRWAAVGSAIADNWDHVLAAIDDVITTPDVDSAAASRATDELAAEPPEPDDESTDVGAETSSATSAATAADGDGPPDDDGGRSTADRVVLGSDDDFWAKVGIDPVQIMTGAGTFYTLRCYLDDSPIFLGRNGRISVFSSERALARYLADEHDHDLSDLATYDDIRTAATDGSLTIDLTDDNIYVLTGLADDFTDGPEAVDRDQLDLAVELLRDVGDYAEDGIVEDTLVPDRPLGKLVGNVLDPESVRAPKAPHAAAVKEWEKLERFVESRLRRE